MRYKVVSIPWAADGTHELDWDAEVATTLKEQSTHVKCVIQPAEAEGSVTRLSLIHISEPTRPY